MPHLVVILFLFALGASIGSFLNVVVWRLPRGKSLVSPPSHCPKCQHRLAWKDNIPVLGWLLLRGRCRYCREPISARYPAVEFATGAMFVLYYVLFFMFHIGPCAPEPAFVGRNVFDVPVYAPRLMGTFVEHWPVYLLLMFLVSSLLAMSLIDAELYIIPLEIPWLLAAAGMVVHAVIDQPRLPGALNLEVGGMAGAWAIGGGVGLAISMALYALGIMPEAFAEGEPALAVDEAIYQQEVKLAKKEGLPPPERAREYTRGEIRREIGKEVLFLAPPVAGGLIAALLVLHVPSVAEAYQRAMGMAWLSGLLGAVLGALVGGFTVWAARILGTVAFGRIAMGLGDVHLMFGVGAIIGAGPAVVAFFIAPFIGLIAGVYRLIRRGGRELPYGPYLSIATGAVLLVYCPIAEYLGPGVAAMGMALRSVM